MDWIKDKSTVIHMVFDKPTSLFAWVTKDGKAYAVRKPSVRAFHSLHTDTVERVQKGTEKLERMAFS
jgi:hypothetical protein